MKWLFLNAFSIT